jgi:hypothetical protein
VAFLAEAHLWHKSAASYFWSPASGTPSPEPPAAVAALRSAIGGGSLHLRGQAGAVAMSAVSRRGRTARLTVMDDVLTSPDSEQIKELRIEGQLD